MQVTHDRRLTLSPWIAAWLVSMTLTPIALAIEKSRPWDQLALDATPAIEEADGRRVKGVRAIYFSSEDYQGKPTKVFAYYGAPEGASAASPVPGVVCVHGGGGTAYSEWVRRWNQEGFAAIAIDTSGNIPAVVEEGDSEQRRHDFSGPPPSGFDEAAAPLTDQWPYHAVAAIVHGNSLLRSFPEVDAENVGVTGISWGGFLTSIAVGIDPRFKFAIPVYGCGFVHEGTSWNQLVDDYGRDRWVALWDPSSHLPRAKMPMLWVNGTNDGHYHLPLFQKSYRLPTGPRSLAIRVRMEHHHPAGWAPPEIYAFAKANVGLGQPLVEVGAVETSDGQASATFHAPEGIDIRSAEFSFTVDDGPWINRHWQTIAATVDAAGDRVVAQTPAEATTCYFNVVDSRGLISSSEHLELR